MAGVTVFGLYVFGLSQLSGAVIHDMHLFWFSALLAVSPCGDALSLHRWLRGGGLRGQPHAAMPAALVYGVPLQCARVLLGIVYFFPGFWKLKTSGLAWIFSDNLRNQIYWKWYQLGAEPPALRVDQLPWLLQLAALAVVVFELSFIALVWSRRGRCWPRPSACCFICGTQCGHGHHVHQPDRCATWCCSTGRRLRADDRASRAADTLPRGRRRSRRRAAPAVTLGLAADRRDDRAGSARRGAGVAARLLSDVRSHRGRQHRRSARRGGARGRHGRGDPGWPEHGRRAEGHRRTGRALAARRVLR